jgi:hypothetical protein
MDISGVTSYSRRDRIESNYGSSSKNRKTAAILTVPSDDEICPGARIAFIDHESLGPIFSAADG